MLKNLTQIIISNNNKKIINKNTHQKFKLKRTIKDKVGHDVLNKYIITESKEIWQKTILSCR